VTRAHADGAAQVCKPLRKSAAPISCPCESSKLTNKRRGHGRDAAQKSFDSQATKDRCMYVEPTLPHTYSVLPKCMHMFATPLIHDITIVPECGPLRCKACPIEVVDRSRNTEACMPRQIMMLLEARNPKATASVLRSAENALCRLQSRPEQNSSGGEICTTSPSIGRCGGGSSVEV
jgi:hypothetical protein